MGVRSSSEMKSKQHAPGLKFFGKLPRPQATGSEGLDNDLLMIPGSDFNMYRKKGLYNRFLNKS